MDTVTPEVVVNSFTVDFFESLAKNPEEINEKFSPLSSVLFDDFQLGSTSADGEGVLPAFQSWATSIADSKMVVDLVRGAAVYGGVTAFVNFHATNGLVNEFFLLSATLEAVVTFDGTKEFYIRQLTISRVGAVPVEIPSNPPPLPPVPEEEEAVKVPTPAPTPKTAQTPAHPLTPRLEEEVPVQEEAEKEAPAPQPEAGSWKARVSSPVVKGEEHKVMRVAATTVKPATKPAPAARDNTNRRDSPKGPRRQEKRPVKAFGDRLMFNTDGHVEDADIKAALGPLAASLVSLRNVSARGHVFMDFEEGVKAFEELQKGIVLGASKKKVGVYRQKNREEKESA